MKEQVSGVVFLMFTVGILFVGIWYYFFSKSFSASLAAKQEPETDSLRTHAVNDIATKLSFLISSSQGQMPLPSDWQQLGSATTGCQLATKHCQVALDSCFDPSQYSTTGLVVPVDAKGGSKEQTGYAIKKDAQDLIIVACYSEADEPVTKKLRLPQQ